METCYPAAGLRQAEAKGCTKFLPTLHLVAGQAAAEKTSFAFLVSNLLPKWRAFFDLDSTAKNLFGVKCIDKRLHDQRGWAPGLCNLIGTLHL